MKLIEPVSYSKNFILRSLLHNSARKRYIRRKLELHQEEDIKNIITLIEQFSTFHPEYDLCISYHRYKMLRIMIGNFGPQLFPISLFMKLYTGYDDGSIPTELLKSYIEKKLFYHKIFYTLNSYDHEGTGFIKENNLKLFFINQEELTTVFNKVEKCNLTYFYISHLCAYTLFMLDPLKIRSVNITDIMRCTLLDKLYQLKKPNSVNDINNWLTFKYVNEHYEQFKIITQGTFVMNSFALGSLAYFKANKAFLARFDEISLNGTEGNDYERYVNLIMAYHSLSNVQSLKYFFDILDTNNDGYVCEWDIKYFYKENQALYKNCQKFEDFVNEIFDIVINNSPSMRKFTLLDLIECRQGDFIIKTLIDTDSFKEFQSLDI